MLEKYDVMDDELRFPVERTFFQRVNIGESKNASKSGDAQEGDRGNLNHVAELHGPWIHEDDLNVENHKKHRYDVEFDRKTWSSIAHRKHTALVGAVFGNVRASGFTEDDAE